MKKNILFITRPLCSFLILICVFTLISCSDDDVEPLTTDMEITVIGPDGSPLSNVPVNLYDNTSDWESATNIIVSDTTSNDGKVTFKGLDSQMYFIDATSEGFANWGSTIESTILAENEVNKLTLTLSDSRVNLLVGKKEKSYLLTDLRLEGFSLFSEVDECEKDNILFFQREENLGLEDLGEVTCVENESRQALFSWVFSEDESELVISDDGDESINYGIISMDENKMILETTIPLEGQMVVVEVDFTAL